MIIKERLHINKNKRVKKELENFKSSLLFIFLPSVSVSQLFQNFSATRVIGKLK